MFDCHVHFIDASRFRYPISRQRSAGFEALLGESAPYRAIISLRT
jgi:hypothetical protein